MQQLNIRLPLKLYAAIKAAAAEAGISMNAWIITRLAEAVVNLELKR
jgi:predicted HicB family RNase H-like nuclease